MKRLTLILLIAIAKIGFAQQDTTLVYNSPMYTKDPVRSKWRPVIRKDGEFYQVAFYDRKDVLQETISFEDKDLTVRKGPYVGYQNGKVKEKGAYSKGHKHGEWISYKSTGDVSKTENFAYGKLDGKYIKYWDGKQIQEEGVYGSNKKAGNWKLMYKDGKVAGEEVYDEAGKKSEGKYFYNNGQPAKYEDLFSPPSYEGGIKEFYKFLASEIKYPKQSAKLGIKGTVKLSFTVKKNGDVEDVEVLESPNNELATEAIRVLEMAPDWIPGKQFGEVVSVKYNIPIKFSL